MRAERKEAFRQQLDERKSQTELIKKMVDKMMPDEDPTEKFISRKCKLDEVRDVLGEELYQFKMNQLKDEFKNLSALN
jgi:formylmethanofuran dehydrogenase subunit E